MNRLRLKILLCSTFLTAGCARDAAPPAKLAAGAPAAGTTPAAPTPPTAVTPASAAPVNQAKLRGELGALGVTVDREVEANVYAAALTADGDFKPGIAAKLLQLESVYSAQVLDQPVFGAGAAQAIAAIPGLTRVTLYRTKATEAAIAAFGDSPTLETLDLNMGSEFPIVTDAGLAGLGKLKSLKKLVCERGKVTPAGMKALSGATTLVELNLRDCVIDDSSAPYLAKLINLTDLNVSSTKLTGKGLAVVAAGATKLRSMEADHNDITDADLSALAALPGLTRLSLADTAVTDAGMAALAKSKSLASVMLEDTKVTDAGVVSLASLPKLWSLSLYRLPLTDACLPALAKAPDLAQLRVGGNKFTADGLAKFATARPKVKVRD